jgi:hypothetical protein
MSPDGWLPDRISIGVLTRAFPPELVDEAVTVTGTREQRRRLLPARLMVYFVLALWLFRGRNSGYGAGDGQARRRPVPPAARRGPAGRAAGPGRLGERGQGRRWKQPNISFLSRGRAKLGADPVRMLFEQVAGPTGTDGAEGVFCCGLRVVAYGWFAGHLSANMSKLAFFGVIESIWSSQPADVLFLFMTPFERDELNRDEVRRGYVTLAEEHALTTVAVPPGDPEEITTFILANLRDRGLLR